MTLKNSDTRLEPRYSLGEASRYVWVNNATLRTWAKGRFYHEGVPETRLLVFVQRFLKLAE